MKTADVTGGTVLVTGAGGFTGPYVAQELARHGLQCVALVADRQHAVSPDFVSSHVGNLADEKSLHAVLQEVRPDYVVHLAAVAFVAHGKAQDFYQTNVIGTRNLLEAIAALPAPPRMTLLASSANVYGNAPVEVITEDTPPAPANDYAVSKLAMEYVAALYAPRFPIVTVRPFNYTGRGQTEQFLIPKIVAHARRQAPVIELGNLDVARDFSDVRTVAECYRRLLQCPQAAGQKVNVCSGRAWSLRQVLQEVQDISGHAMEVRVNPAFVRASEVAVLRGSRARLESLVGPVPGVSLRDTLAWMLAPTT